MSYLSRIKKPIDVIKQPWLDFWRVLSHLIYQNLNKKTSIRKYPDKVNKILLIRRNRLGDAVNVLPLIESIRQNHPHIEIHVLANTYNAVIFRHAHHINKIHEIDEKWGLGKISFFRHPVLLKLAQENFDLVIGVGGYSSVLAQLVFWIRGKYNVGPRSKSGTLYDLVFDTVLPASLINCNQHHVDDMARIISQAKLSLSKPLPYVKLIRPNSPNPKWLALCPDTKRKESQYPIELYGEIVTTLVAKGALEKILLFTETPRSKYQKLVNSGAEYCPTNNVDDFIQHVSKCQLALTAEGGSAHITAALGLDVVVLSGVGNQSYWRPYAEHVTVLEKKNAINEIKVDDVITAIRGRLE